MFEVREQTARDLFRAQQPHLQGRLRLDISSRCSPEDLDQPLDVRCARVAIGERVVNLLHGCAVEARLPTSARDGFLLNALPPTPDASARLLVMPNGREFEAFVVHRLNNVFGLDAQGLHYWPALGHLAEDLYGWGQTDEAQKEFDFVADTQKQQLFIRCKCAQPKLSDLEPADQVWHQSADQ